MKYYVSVVQILGEEKYSKTIWKYFMRINFTIIRTMCLGYYTNLEKMHSFQDVSKSDSILQILANI